jgi:DNA-binding NarL/FixJ family response regulator
LATVRPEKIWRLWAAVYHAKGYAVIRLLIVDKLRCMCDAMVSILQNEADISVTNVATTMHEALHQLDHCDVVLVSADLPDEGALELIRAATAGHPEVKVIAMDVAGSVAGALRYVKAGAAGYVLEEDSVDELLAKVRAVHSHRHPAYLLWL